MKRMCAELSALGCDIVTGGGPGLMQAANEGARVSSRLKCGNWIRSDVR